MDEILATIRRIIAEDEQSSASSAAATATSSARSIGAVANTNADPRPTSEVRPLAGAGDDVLELTEALNDDGSVRHLTPIGSPSAASRLREPPPATTVTDAEGELKPEPELLRDIQSTTQAPEAPGTATDEKLVSEVASLATAAAFARLAATPRPHREPALLGARPLDDVVQDLLRPLLRSWLDENLPAIVERLVQAEIARVTSRSDPG